MAEGRSEDMGRNVAIGIQGFDELIESKCFYVDKTAFIKEWWETNDKITLITRPRRFGKTLNMSMLECFFSNKYENRGDLFEGLNIWEYDEYRKIQGTYPVISLSFANVKETDYKSVMKQINSILVKIYSQNIFLLDTGILTETEIEYYKSVNIQMDRVTAAATIHNMCDFLSRYYGKKVIVLLDEYDVPMQEAYINGYWNELVAFFRSMFTAAFKDNPYLERAVMTGVTRISKESMFSGLNNLEVVTTTSQKYETAFGFTEEEVFAAMDEMGFIEKDKVKYWYDGFTFGEKSDIYNPWSIINYLNKGKFKAYWSNTSSNSLAGKLIREGTKNIKRDFEQLLQGDTIETRIDEEIVFGNLNGSPMAIWSLLLTSGYLRVVSVDDVTGKYTLKLTNYEIKSVFENMVSEWFETGDSNYNEFIETLLIGDVETMNEYMNDIALNTFSYFDTSGKNDEPERFYHGFVLGLIVDLRDKYIITSNRESGKGRYDIMMEPVDKDKYDGIIIEFKVFNKRKEKNLQETVESALKQIEEKNYAQSLIDQGVKPERIRKYGFAFEGKTVEIG
jgi:hypothetical protein